MTLNSEITDKPVALGFQIELEFGNVGFWGEGKTGEPGEKPLGARTRTNNKLNPHLTPSPGIEPGPHWWEACVGGKCSTTAPSLLPCFGYGFQTLRAWPFISRKKDSLPVRTKVPRSSRVFFR